MSNVLSQEEIDALLSAINSGDEASTTEDHRPGDDVRIYDFRTADRFPKEQIRTFRSIFESFSQLLANQLTGNLRTVCTAKVLSVEELTYFDFSNSMPSQVILAIIGIPPLTGNILMMLSPEIAYSMINRIFGGSIEAVDAEKAFTEIELAVLERTIHQIMGLFDEAWQKVIEVDAGLERIETSSQFAQIVALNEPCALVTLEVHIGETTGMINICLPHIAIEPITNQLSSRMWFASRQRDLEPRERDIRMSLANSDVEVKSIFDHTMATVRDILCLQAGDVVRLTHSIKQPITITVEDVPKFHASIGVSGSRYAVKVADLIQEEDNHE